MEYFDRKVYTEVYEVLKLMTEDMRNKIPNKLLEEIETNRDKEYKISFEQIERDEISEEAKRILAVIYTDYLTNEKEREIIKTKEKEVIERREIQSREKYGTEVNFKQEKKEEIQENRLTVIEEKKWYQKIFEKIKKILRFKK